MYSRVDKLKLGSRNAIVQQVYKKRAGDKSHSIHVDNNAHSIAQRSLNASIRNSPQVNQYKNYQYMADNSSSSAVRRAETRPHVVQKVEVISQKKNVHEQSDNIVQCYGTIRFANLKNKQKYRSKADAIIAVLQASPNINQFLNNKNVLIVLESNSAISSISVVGDQVQISLSSWFFEQESRGRIVGMLLHEFAVHPLANEQIGPGNLAQEAIDIQQNTPFPTNIPGHDNHTVTPGAAGQTDHIFAAVTGQPRFLVYQQTAYELASAMFERTVNNPDVTEAHVTDLIMTYLSDLAMILATNDNRIQILTQSDRTADAFNFVKQNWLQFIAGKNNANDLTRLTPPNKTGGDVISEVLKLAGSVVLSIGTKSTDDSQFEQTNTGFFDPIYSDLTQVQTNVLMDYGWGLANRNIGGNTPSFLNALDDALGVGDGDTSSQLCDLIRDQFDQNDLNQQVREKLNVLIQYLQNNRIRQPITLDDLHFISALLRLTIRVVMPDGRIISMGNGLNTITLFQVPKPRIHYRYTN